MMSQSLLKCKEHTKKHRFQQICWILFIAAAFMCAESVRLNMNDNTVTYTQTQTALVFTSAYTNVTSSVHFFSIHYYYYFSNAAAAATAGFSKCACRKLHIFT